MITQGKLEYRVIGNPPDEYTRIEMKDVNRHFFDAFPVKATHGIDPRTNRSYYTKIFKRQNTEIWLTCYELNRNGRRDGVMEPEPSSRPTHTDLDDAASNIRKAAAEAGVLSGWYELGSNNGVVIHCDSGATVSLSQNDLQIASHIMS